MWEYKIKHNNFYQGLIVTNDLYVIGVPRSVVDLLALPLEDSDTILNVSWKLPPESNGVITLHYVIITNYSLDSVANLTLRGDTTSITVTGLGE